MKMTADDNLKFALSLAQNLSDGDTNGAAIDCAGYEEALAILAHGNLGGTSPTSDVKWQETVEDPASPGSPLASGWADISGAAHKQVLINPTRVVNTVNLTNTTLTIAAQPANPSRLRIDVVDTTASITAGTVTIVGTRPPKEGEVGSQAVTEAVSFTGAAIKFTNAIFDAVTSVVTSGFTVLGGSGDETIKVGVSNDDVQVPHVGRIDLKKRKRFLRAVEDAGGTSPTGEVVAGLVLGAAKVNPVTQIVPSEFSV